MTTHSQHLNDCEYTCSQLYAYDALNLLPGVMSLFPEDEVYVMTTSSGRKAVKDDPASLAYLAKKEGLSDEVFLYSLFRKSNLHCEGQPVVDIENHFDDVYHLFEVLSWIVEVSFLEALSRPQIEIPDILRNIDKLVKQKYNTPDTSEPMAPQLRENGVPPPNISPWLFSVLASVHKEQRVDWQLLEKCKKEYYLLDFLDIWECVESAKSYEASAMLANL